MRLWHKELIQVLPNKQLLSQWRELNAIARNIQINGTPNHILVNKVLNYDNAHFLAYTKLVLKELKNRNYRIRQDTFQRFLRYTNTTEEAFDDIDINFSDIYKDWHNDRYFLQCYYNLQEKYDCSGISEEDWSKIQEKFCEHTIEKL